jgi:hypothetical protein
VANLSPVSTKQAANLLPVSTRPVANLSLVSTTPATNFATGTAVVVETGVYSGVTVISLRYQTNVQSLFIK